MLVSALFLTHDKDTALDSSSLFTRALFMSDTLSPSIIYDQLLKFQETQFASLDKLATQQELVTSALSEQTKALAQLLKFVQAGEYHLLAECT